MKNQKFIRPALVFLITGLLMVTITPLINRFYHMPDAVTGFIAGLGLASEIISLGIMQKERKKHCRLT